MTNRNIRMLRRVCSAAIIAEISLTAIGQASLAQSPSAAKQPASGGAQPVASEQTGVEEIVVTAQHRSENLQRVPISISAVTADALTRNGIDSTTAISQVVPSVQFTRAGPSGLFFVRGVGSTNAAVGEEGASAFYIDGVYLPDLGQTINNFNNIERIEVLKGPQGTLFGRNAFGGLINIVTREPGDTFVASGEATVATYKTVSGKLYVAGPLAPNLSADLALTGQHQGDGWGRNLTLDRDNQLEHYWGARSKLVFRPAGGAKLTLAGDYYWDKDNTGAGWRQVDGYVGTGGYGSPGGHDTLSDHYPYSRIKTWGLSLTGNFDLGFANLVSLASVRDSKNTTHLDVEAGPLPILNIDYLSGSRAYQGELRLASKRTEPFSWQVGGFYLRNRAFNQSLFYGTAFGAARNQYIDAAQKTNSYAFFGEATYALTPTTHVTGGIRFTKDSRKESGVVITNTQAASPATVPTIGRQSYQEVTYRVAIRQDLTPDINVYGSINRGFKAGTFNLQSPTLPPVEPEYIMAYEAGFKSELFGRRLRLNLAGFHYDISDYQVRSGAGSATGSSILLNAASVKIDGAELEFDAAFIDRLRLYGGFTWLHARFDKFGGPGAIYQAPFDYARPAVCDTPQTFDSDPGRVLGPPTGGLLTCYGNAGGKQVPLAPKFAATMGATYTVPLRNTGSIRVSGVVSYNSGYPFDPANFFRQADFVLLNGSVEYRPTKHWGIGAWVKNLTNTQWIATVNTTGTGAYTALSAPRTYGVTAKFDF